MENGKHEPAEIAQMATLVADWLRTGYRGKGHGGYNIYEDDRIHISRDTHVPNVRIALIDESGKRSEVYRASYHAHHRPDVFRPGLWIRHLASLTPSAERARDRRDAERCRQDKDEYERRHACVDDAGLFPDHAGVS